MNRREVGPLVYYEFDVLSHVEGLVHGISTRHGGISPAPFSTLNLGLAAGDAKANAAANLVLWHTALGLDPASTVTAGQAQANRVAVVGQRDRGSRIDDVDALLTSEPGVSLMLKFADCVPVMLYDPVHRAVGLVHSGWRGTVGKVTTAAVRAMAQAFETRPNEIIACIGPSIGPCCYRVGSTVIDQVRASFPEGDSLLVRQPDGALHLDLWQANAIQLVQAGVEKLENARMCTADRTDEFFSWRAEGGKTGRMAGVIALTF